MTPLSRDFYQRPTVEVAKDLLGKVLVHRQPGVMTAGIIVETEAYLYPDDPAAHSYHGPSPRSQPMFGPAGQAYVYLIYGMYHCVNVVTGPEGEAVLIRALEPVLGIETMKQRRGQEQETDLTSGPGKLTQALGITLDQNEADLVSSQLQLVESEYSREINSEQITATPRVGITKATERPLRFTVAGSSYLSF